MSKRIRRLLVVEIMPGGGMKPIHEPLTVPKGKLWARGTAVDGRILAVVNVVEGAWVQSIIKEDRVFEKMAESDLLAPKKEPACESKAPRERDLKYHEGEQVAENVRTAGRNAWVAALRESLAPKDATDE